MAESKTTVTRRDFINSTLVGTGAALLSAHAPFAGAANGKRALPPFVAPAKNWYGFGGVGDYAVAHGNTPELVANAHGIRHGLYDTVQSDWIDTGEIYDTVIVGAGMAGLGAAYEFSTTMPESKRCLVLDDHPVFGGESKQNEFEVNGYRLTGPQGANGFSIPPASAADEPAYAVGDAYYYDRLGIPRQFDYSVPTGGADSIRFGNDNYGFLYWLQDEIDTSHFFQSDGKARHAVNTWANNLRDLQVSDQVRQSLLEWNMTTRRPHPDEGLADWLDGMSCKHYLENVLGLDAAVTAYVDPIIAAGVGSGCDTTSAYMMFAVGLPGFKGYHDVHIDNRHSFPGGNSGFARHFVKRIMPRAIAGDDSFEDIINGDIQFSQLDRKSERICMRLSSTVVHVEHANMIANASDWVWVSYLKDSKMCRVRTRSVVMASGGWVNKHVVRDLPKPHFEAYNTFNHAAFLVVNVALTNWEFMHKLGISACRYQGEFGTSCNLRNPMAVGDNKHPHDPGKPAILTFYVPFFTPGETAAAQGNIGRLQLFSTSYADYEQQIIRQMNELFSASGFNADKDVAGIVLNRWGHAYVMPEPGFFFGRNGQTPASQVVSQRHGRVAFGHSELKGLQHWGPAAGEGRRAFIELRDLI